MNKTAYLIRHGLIQSNEDHVYAGRNAEKLTESGEKEADRVGREIAGFGIMRIYTSPLQRTLQTAEILNRHCNAELIKDENLTEIELGPWTGLSKDEVQKNYPSQYETWVNRPGQFDAAGMETLDSVQQRVVRSLNRFLHSGSESVAAFVTHAVAVKTAVLHFRRLPMDLYHRIDVPNLCIYRVDFNEHGNGEVERLK